MVPLVLGFLVFVVMGLGLIYLILKENNVWPIVRGQERERSLLEARAKEMARERYRRVIDEKMKDVHDWYMFQKWDRVPQQYIDAAVRELECNAGPSSKSTKAE